MGWIVRTNITIIHSITAASQLGFRKCYVIRPFTVIYKVRPLIGWVLLKVR